MKQFIKKLLRETLINERLMNVDIDVDFIYDNFFKSDIDEIKETGIITKDMFKTTDITTSDLTSQLAQKGNKLNKCQIIMNHYNSNFYSPNNKIISCTINKNALNYVINHFNGDLNKAVSDFKRDGDIKSANSIFAEFTESKMKGSIHHELAHWLDDTLHNNHIKARAINSKESGTDMTKKGLPINADKLEIEGQIHNIVQLKKAHMSEWDDLTFNDLIRLSPTFNVINNQLKGAIKQQWLRDLKTRMHREDLLGKKMYN